MSLDEITKGLHWESACHSQTTGMGPMWIDDLIDRPPWAVIYMIVSDFGSDEWEIGSVKDFESSMPSAMPRCPIVSNNGLGISTNFSDGIKTIWFADAAPAALERYMKRLEHEANARTWETAETRAQAWERLKGGC